MKRFLIRALRSLTVAALIAFAVAPMAMAQVPTPESVLGYKPGADF